MHIGIDIGGTTIGIGMLNGKHELVYYEKIETPKSYEPALVEKTILNKLKENVENKSISLENVKSIGIGVPGVVSLNRKNIINCPNLKWKNIRFGQTIEDYFHVKSCLFNDGSSAAFGEYRLGKMKGYLSGVQITLGTGVGGGIILDGKVFEGSHGIASEIGHIIVGENNYACGCGRIGCLETFSSATAIMKFANDLALKKKGKLVASSAKDVFELYKQEDDIAVASVERFIKYLSIGISNIIATLDPEIIVLAGGVSMSGELYLEKLKKSVSDYRYFKEVPSPRIELSQLGEKSGTIGAALLGKENCSI